MSRYNDDDIPLLSQVDRTFRRETQTIKNATSGKGFGSGWGFGKPRNGGNQGGIKGGKPVNKYTIVITRNPGGFVGRVSVGSSLFGKKRDYSGQTLDELFVHVKESAKRIFAINMPQQQQTYAAPAEDMSPRVPNIIDDEATQCNKCGGPVRYDRFCPECGTRAPKKPTPESQPDLPTDLTTCTKCKAQVKYGKFCPECGERAPAKPFAAVMTDMLSDLTTCVKCGSPVPWGKHCLEDGLKAPEKPATPKFKYCGDCGNQVPTDKKFCISCGSKL